MPETKPSVSQLTLYLTSSLKITSSYAITASYALNASGGGGGTSGTSGTSGGGASLRTGSTYPITASYSRKSITASYLTTISQSLIPAKNNTYSLGTTDVRWKDLFVSTGSIYIGDVKLSTSGSTVLANSFPIVVVNTSSKQLEVPGLPIQLTSSYANKALTASYVTGVGVGSSGTSGTSGAAGSSGTSGVGSPGTSGTAGSSGTSSTATLQTGSLAKQTILYNVTSGSQNVITGLNLSGNKWGVDIKEEWDAVIVAGDTYYNSCSLLLHFNGSNGSTIFTDNSPTPKTATPAGNAQISTAQSKFGGASLYLDGTGDYLTFPSNSQFAYGTGNFTIECWVYFAAGSSYRQIFSNRPTPGSVSSEGSLAINPSNGLSWYTNTFIIDYTTSIGTNQWVHVAICRNGSSLKVFANGVQVGSTTNSDNLTSTSFTIGANGNGSEAFNGYIDEFRITKGIARYTSNFTPRTSEFSNNAASTQYATKYIGLIGGLNDRSVDYGVQKLSDTSLKVVKMTQTTSPFPSGSLSSSVDRVYVNVLNYTNVSVTSSYATNALTASYILGGGANGSSGTSGATGATGTSGTSGNSGSSGSSGTSGATGTSGTSGNSGTSGSSGANGTSGSSGATGASGSSGTSGGGASLTTGSLYPITSSWSRRSLTASYALNASGGGSSLAGAQTFISNGSQTVYTLNQSVVNRDQILVVTNGVVQSRTGSNYTVSGTTLTLSEAVQSGGLVDVRYINAGQGSSGTSGINGTVQTGSIAKQTILYNVTSGSQNVITGLNLSGNKWGVDIKEEWDEVISPGDQYYNSCSLLLHCDGINGSTTFTDNSPSPKTVTSNNGTAISTVQSKFGGASAFFDGTNDYLSTPNTVSNFGTDDFTIECWFYRVSTNSILISNATGADNNYFAINADASNAVIQIRDNSSQAFAYGPSTTLNVWNHIAVTRNAGTVRVFVNGVSGTPVSITKSFTSRSTIIGGFLYTGFEGYFNGYIDEIRITKGVARYTSNFTPSSVAFPNNTGVTQYATKYIGLIGGLNDKSVDYGVQKLSDTSLKVVKMTQTTTPFTSGSLSSSVDRVYVNVLDYSKVAVTSSYATNALNSVNSLDIPKIKSIIYTNSSYTPTTASAVDLAKPNTSYITISGSNFKPSASIFIDNTSGSIVTYVNSNKLNVNVISKNIGTYPIYLSNTDGASTFKINAITYIYTGYTIGYLIVAGGGAGGSAGPNDNRGGGGGGGGFVSGSMMVYKTGSFVVTVGSGGSVVSPSGTGTNGNTSSFGPNIIALGGGGGGGAATTGRSGGSGGGGGASLGPGNWSGGAGSQPSQAYGGFGNAGGTGGTNNVNYRSGGGGGGAGGIGGDASISSATGGVGKGSDLTGSLKYYSGGGGSSNGSASPQGGGGNYGVAGSVNTGGGGGGATSAAQGGAGGSGIVIIRYSGPQKGTGGTIKELGGYTIHTFFTSGTFTP